MDSGKIVKKDGELFIDVTLNKRYITSAAFTVDLMGVANKVKDPDNLLETGAGITVALLENPYFELAPN